MSLYGLRCMSSDSLEVCELLRAFTQKVQGCKEDFESQGVGNALYGLQ
jgi:hypothetical protein